MANMKCEMTIENWDEEYLRECVSEKLADRIVATVAPDRDQLRRKTNDVIQSKLGPIIDEAMAKPLQATNAYGEPTGKAISMTEAIFKQVEGYLQAKVRVDGSPGDYNSNQTRLKWIVSKILEEHLKAIKAEVVVAADAAIKGSARTEIEKCLKNILGVKA
jgi:hypothetical protein